MHTSLSWIEWLDRLDRIITSARHEVAAIARVESARGLAAIDRSRRQLAALTGELRLLDRTVLSAGPLPRAADGADDLQRALDTALFHLARLTAPRPVHSPADGDRLLTAIDSALQDVVYEAAVLVSPRRRRA